MVTLQGLVIAGNVGLDARGRLVPTLPEPPEGHTTLAILFDEDVCVVAAVVILDLGGVRNSVEVAFDFHRPGRHPDRARDQVSCRHNAPGLQRGQLRQPLRRPAPDRARTGRPRHFGAARPALQPRALS